MTSPYITEAMRRRELPISVKVVGAVNDTSFLVFHIDNGIYAKHKINWRLSVKGATAAYLAAINELSKEG